MISRRVRIQLVVFAVISALGVMYTGLRYVGFHVFGGPYKIVADFPDSGGIFTGAAVTDRGVTVGKVGTLRLIPHGVAVTLLINQGTKIPADSRAVVANLSAVGEQYVDVQPQTDSGPYLRSGGVIPLGRTQIPLDDATLVANWDALARSINLKALSVTINELGKAFDNTGPDLQRLIDAGDALTAAAQQNLPMTVRLINDGRTVLNTQRATSQDLQTFAANLNGLSQQIVTSDPDIRRLFNTGVQSARQLTGLLQQNENVLPVFLGNLDALGQIQAARIPGLKSILVLYPLNVANGFLASAPIPGVSKTGIAHFGLVMTPPPSPCNHGYESTKRRPNTPPFWGGAANLNTYCLPGGKNSGTPGSPGYEATTTNPSGSDARGAYYAPRPAGDNTNQPPPGGYPQDTPAGGYSQPPYGSSSSSGAATNGSSTGSSGQGAPVATPYDPVTGLFVGPDGRAYQLGSSGASQSFGSQGWEWLLISPLLG